MSPRAVFYVCLGACVSSKCRPSPGSRVQLSSENTQGAGAQLIGTPAKGKTQTRIKGEIKRYTQDSISAACLQPKQLQTFTGERD